MARNETLFEAITKGKREIVVEQVEAALAASQDPVGLLNDSMIPAMREVGDRFSRNEIFVPEMLIAARAMQAGLDLVEPLLEKQGHKPRGRVCVGTVKGDLHDIGKNLVAMMLKGAGFQVDDLGVDCTAERFVAAADAGAQVACLSALLTTTMPGMREVVEAMKGRDVRVVIGGAPVTPEFAAEIGADGYGSDANEAVTAVEKALGLV